ncbi:hypothetical protein BCR42DRAFT_405028 [Absidia repens]|uniref:Uncharacterized protein n=1 Tax=Absidia repens TaxID=90262 RepID=A0A1X2IX04_9FUNG|nr:hypothetical protein BCR42DRAFT_405028 [Absidia repens]
MSTTEPFPTSLRHRKSVVVRKLDSDIELLHTDQRKTAKQRWSACLAFIFKRSKLKSDSPAHAMSTSSSSSSLTASETATLPSGHLHPNDHGDISNSISEKATYHYSVSLPPTPVSSLSPPPRHIMTRQNRTKSLTPMDQPSTASSQPFSSTPILPISSNTLLPPPPPPPPSSTKPEITTLTKFSPVQQQRRQCIRRSSTLRLSLDVDQRYSYTSSLHSSDEAYDDNGEMGPCYKFNNDEIAQNPQDTSSPADSSIRQQQQQQQPQQQQRYCYWKEESAPITKQWTKGSMAQQVHQPPFILNFDDTFEDDDDDDYGSGSSRQIRKQKAHYEAVVTSTMYHHHRPSSCQDDDDNDNDDVNDSIGFDRPQSPSSSSMNTKMDPFLDTPPSSAPLLKSSPSFPPLPSSPHSLASLDTPS